jgi:trimethylamine--corrinoid protein Co-methyltransferase
MHLGILEILEQVGVRADTPRILQVFKDGGADINEHNKLVKIPQNLVLEAISKAPKKIRLCARNPKWDIILEDDRVSFGLGGSPKSRILDINTGNFRSPTKKDIEDTTRLGDALSGYSFIQNLGHASDKPPEVQYVHVSHAMMNNGEKHLLCTAPSAEEARFVIDMGMAIEDLSKRPVISIYTNPASPLILTPSQENIIESASRGVPMVVCTAPMAGVTAPMTLAGAVVQNLCENLMVLTLAQLVRPGIPVVLGATPTVIDPRTSMFTIGSPEFMVEQILSTELSHYYHLPYFGGGGTSDSKLPDGQAAAEAAMTALTSAMAGMNMIQDCAVIAFDDAGCLEMAVIVDEIIGMVERILRGASIDDESLALDVIEKVGPGGHFMSQKHTLEHAKKELYIPKIFDRNPESTWLKAGGKDIRQVANERAKKILTEHRPTPLPKDVQQKLDEIVREAEKTLIGRRGAAAAAR